MTAKAQTSLPDAGQRRDDGATLRRAKASQGEGEGEKGRWGCHRTKRRGEGTSQGDITKMGRNEKTGRCLNEYS